MYIFKGSGLVSQSRLSGLLISPSEPMLALAAAEGLNMSEATYQQAMRTLLDELILKALYSIGPPG